MISGKTTLIAHIGYPTEAFKAPLIYNPWFDQHGIDAVVVPMGVKAEDYPTSLKSIFKFTNIRGALVTMPHKITTAGLVDECSTTAKIAGSANAILKRPDGTLLAVTRIGTERFCPKPNFSACACRASGPSVIPKLAKVVLHECANASDRLCTPCALPSVTE